MSNLASMYLDKIYSMRNWTLPLVLKTVYQILHVRASVVVCFTPEDRDHARVFCLMGCFLYFLIRLPEAVTIEDPVAARIWSVQRIEDLPLLRSKSATTTNFYILFSLCYVTAEIKNGSRNANLFLILISSRMETFAYLPTPHLH